MSSTTASAAAAAAAQISSNKTDILKKSRTTILQLLERQGYVVDDYINFSINDIHAMQLANQMDMLVSHRDSPRKVYVKYLTESKISKQVLEPIVEDLYLDDSPLLTDSDTLVIISGDEPNDTLQTKLRDLHDIEHKFIIVLHIKRLLYNILDHTLQPKFHILTDAELEDVIKRYNIRKMSHFPEISRFDPVAQCLFMRPGKVCRILRDSLTSVETTYYRMCV